MRGFVFVTLILLLLAGCVSYKRISEIKSEPDRYLNSDVMVKGRVTQTISFPLSAKGFYQVDDGEANIWVYTEHGMPVRGEKVRVKGTVKSGVTLLGKTFAILLIEKERK